MGHSQISLTLGTYSHVAPELSTDAADRMAATLWDTTNSDKPQPKSEEETEEEPEAE
ncbi:hypothetical protein [Frankia sp. AgB32]|uniref:hypothetical protein n=1 Tax=Frankia sp. AgB32 TaxID=631119 RepID=UPI00200E75BB|nr:hypothetical protein [Frankia sp. AgB32]MCK9897039.1 hypothetical protein [Frankia sp. AgB32]